MSLNRQAIRDWVATKRLELESAQAAGTLARSKLDLKDQAKADFRDQWASDANGFSTMLEEELEAFCADMRLASVTVQQQVERIERHNLRGALLGIFAALVALLILAGMGGNGTDVGPGLGFTLPIVIGVIVFFLAR